MRPISTELNLMSTSGREVSRSGIEQKLIRVVDAVYPVGNGMVDNDGEFPLFTKKSSGLGGQYMGKVFFMILRGVLESTAF
jgi:hypothetical protein